jgi:hypothetical protein
MPGKLPITVPTMAEMKAFLERAKAYKDQFTSGFYHGSPSNSIKAFDPSKGDRAFPTEGVTFLTKEPEFAHSFIDVHKNKTRGGWDYDKGSTIYPVSANLGKHFDPATPEGSETIKQYLQNKYSKEVGTDYFDDAINQKHEHMMDRLTDPVNNWKLLESPDLLDHLKNTGHNSFSVTEGGIKNIGIFDPSNIRGKFANFNPDQAASPEFMKAAGGAVQHMAGGGEVLKKLAHAIAVPFTHFSPQEAITVLDPRKYGSGMRGAEAARLSNAPDIAPRSFFYHGESIVPESGVGGNKYSGVSQSSYPLSKDPGDFYTKSRTNDPHLMEMGITQHSPEHTINNMERMIKNAGYSGYHTDTGTGVLFHETPVTKID